MRFTWTEWVDNGWSSRNIPNPLWVVMLDQPGAASEAPSPTYFDNELEALVWMENRPEPRMLLRKLDTNRHSWVTIAEKGCDK